METQAYHSLMKLAAELRQPDESVAQSFAKVSRTAGQKLFAEHQRQQLGSALSHVPAAVEKSAPPATVWSGLVSAVMRIEKCSYSKAVDLCLKTEEGRFAFKACNAAELAKNYGPADLAYYNAEVSKANNSIDLAKAAKPAAFMELVSQTRSKYPNMSMSDAMEHTRVQFPKIWEDWKKLGVPGNPSDGKLSGKPSPSRAPLWEGEQTSSHLTPPPKVEIMEGPNPKFKRDAEIAKQNFAFFVDVLCKASERAGKPWSAAEAVGILQKCPAANQYLLAAAGV
jgi:hypothetical protein